MVNAHGALRRAGIRRGAVAGSRGVAARVGPESIPVDEQDHIGGWLELHAEAREFWRHRARFVLQAFHEMRRSTIHETPEIGGSRWEDPRNLSGGWTDVE